MNASVTQRRAARALGYAYARDHGVLLTELDDQLASAWLRQPGADLAALAEISRALKVTLSIRTVPGGEFDDFLARRHAESETADDVLTENLERDENLAAVLQNMPPGQDLAEATDEAPVIRVINALFSEAMRAEASDIHLEPFESCSLVRFRRDGQLHDVITPPRGLHAALVSRIKVMAQLDIAEKRLPQDGRIALRIAGRPVDVRVSTVPTGQGERVVLRLLRKDAGCLELGQLGMSLGIQRALDEAIQMPHGLVLVTGPTGSGKTTTLYAALSRLDRHRLNIITVEDPIEYELSGIGQIPVNSRIDMSFARALRAILRQDPDVIMIGEIRDAETAQIAVQASLTGHLVLATLHTNDATSAVTRLIDMGVEPFLLASSLVGVLAQRLVRRLCPACRQAYQPEPEEMRWVGNLEVLWRPPSQPGCTACHDSGYQGRTGIYEMLRVDDKLRQLIHDRATEQSFRSQAERDGLLSLRDDGLRWLAAGETSLAELLRATRD